MITHSIFNVYVLPFAMVAIFARVFMDSRTAFMTNVVMVLACAVAVRYQYEFVVIQLLSGLIAIYSLRELSSRSQLFKTALWVTSGNMVVFFAIQLMQSNDIMKMDFDMYTLFIVNGVLLLLAYPLMYLIEKLFGFVSNVTLIELSNTNKGVLRDLSEIAPGTFHRIYRPHPASFIRLQRNGYHMFRNLGKRGFGRFLYRYNTPIHTRSNPQKHHPICYLHRTIYLK